VADFVKFILYRVVGYRKQVVESNLRLVFPEKSDKEIQKLVSGSYRNLADVLVEGLKAFTMTRSQIRRRHKVLNPEICDQYYKDKRSVIAVPCHYGNWEWGSMSGSLQLIHQFVVFYKPLANKWVDRFARWSRAKYGGNLVSIYETAKIFRNYQNENSIFIMAADQSPSNASKAIWVDFLGRDTAFLHGPEFYAKKFNLPVVFVDIQRRRRGFYELTLEVIADNPSELEAGEITQRYATKLEEAIREKPENWLWSHRRWKHSRTE
jgi:KDO2-lipid IV(A) lauroyltransferase